MASVGGSKPGLEDVCASLVGFGGLPALVFRSRTAESAPTALNPYRFAGYAGTGGEVTIPPGSGMNAGSRFYVPWSYYVMFGVFVALALSGSVLRLLLRGRARPEA